MDNIIRTAIATALLGAVVVFVTFVYQSIDVASDIKSARGAVLFETTPTMSLKKLEGQISSMPLQPDFLHGLIAYRVKQRGAQTLNTTERRAMQSLGWQSNIVQLDLFKDGLNRGDVAAVMKRIDGLLRRGKMTEKLVNVLINIEHVDAPARRKLVDLLIDKPNWRRAFLTAPAGYTGADAVKARASTLEQMFALDLAPQREEIAPIVNGLDAMGERDQAAALWRKFHHLQQPTPPLFDPKFITLASDPLNRQYQTMVYEWQPGSGPGYSARARKTGKDSAVLNIRWNGRAAPVFIRQRLISEPGDFMVGVKGLGLNAGAVRRFAFVFYCPTGPIFYDMISQRPDGSFVFSGTEPVTCANPELRLVGMPHDNPNPLEVKLTSIHLRSKPSSFLTNEHPTEPIRTK